MSQDDDHKEIYTTAYAAFDQGDFHTAVLLASRCIAASPPKSYWHFGALGLRCWAANYLEDSKSVERDARVLLETQTGSEKPWFDGLAWLNLGLVYRRAGDAFMARECFTRASSRYLAYEVDPKQPEAWQKVNQFFVAIALWAASGATDGLKRLARDLASKSKSSEEINHLACAVDLYLRHTQGDMVRAEAEEAARVGVSRAFLALLLLDEGIESSTLGAG